MYKDKRFSALFANKTDNSDYMKQKALYYKYVEE